MQSPKVGKSPVGHLNALVGSGLRSYSYPGHAAQLLGYKQSASPTALQHASLPGSDDSALNYIDRNTNLLEGLEATIPSRKENGIEKHSEVLAPKVDLATHHLNEQQQIKSRSKNEVEEYALRSIKPSTSSPASLPERVNAAVTTAHSIISDSTAIDSAHRVSSTKTTTTQVSTNMNSVNTNLVATNLPTAHANRPESASRNDANAIQKVSAAKTEPAPLPLIQERAGEISENKVDVNMNAPQHPEARASASPISSVEKVMVKKNNYELLHKRYQAMLDNPELSSRFNADPKTRAAMVRMQERLANNNDSILPELAITDTKNKGPLPPLKPDTQTKLNYFQPVKTELVKISNAITHNFQSFPSPGAFRNAEMIKQKGKIEKLEAELNHQRDLISKISAENRKYQSQLSKLESAQTKSGSNSKRDSGGSTFWAKNRLTHAMLRIQS